MIDFDKLREYAKDPYTQVYELQKLAIFALDALEYVAENDASYIVHEAITKSCLDEIAANYDELYG